MPTAFALDDLDLVHALVESVGVAQLVTVGDDRIDATLVPVVLDREAGPFGTVRAHLARANPQWRTADVTHEALLVVSGPDAYVSPAWYASKAEHGRVVPTWDYVAVHLRGRLRVHDDPAWLRGVVTQLTDRHEDGRPEPWSVDDAPGDFIDAMLRGIVGVEVEITAVEGKAKLSQNRPPADVAGVVTGLEASGDPGAVDVAEAIRRQAGLPDASPPADALP